MARPQLPIREKVARALAELHAVLGDARNVVRGAELKVASRTVLRDAGWLREIIKGWYFVCDPAAEDGDTTLFFANFWEYLGSYLVGRFGDDYCLSAEDSLGRHARANVVPRQVGVLLKVRQSQIQPLAHGYSLAMYPSQAFPSGFNTTMLEGLRVMALPYCLVQLGPAAYRNCQSDVEVVLRTLPDASDIARLIDINATGVARVVAALRQIERHDLAGGIETILSGMRVSLPKVPNPFEQPTIRLASRLLSPLHARVGMLWARYRADVLAEKVTVPASFSVAGYLTQVEAVRVEDTYHSLSIERYRVTPELIQRVADSVWDAEIEKNNRDALAAKGYLDAFGQVAQDAGRAFERRSAADAAGLFADRHHAWFQALFGVSVDVGLLKASDLAGYRRHMVFLRGSLHSPPHFDYVRDGMQALLACLAEEPDSFVQAVLGHWLFGYVHPYMDGNGRMARFLMNVMLAGGGYPWTVIRLEDRTAYMAALEQASVASDIGPFARFVAASLRRDQKRREDKSPLTPERINPP